MLYAMLGISITLVITFIVLRVVKGGICGLYSKAVASLGFVALGLYCAYLGGFNNVVMFVLLGLIFGLLGDIVLRHRIVSTRADLKGRLNDIFRDFSGSLEALDIRINWLKTTEEYWGCHWNNTNFNAALRTRWESNSH